MHFCHEELYALTSLIPMWDQMILWIRMRVRQARVKIFRHALDNTQEG